MPPLCARPHIHTVMSNAFKSENVVLIECLKGGKPMIKIAPPLIVNKEQGVYTEEIYDVYGY